MDIFHLFSSYGWGFAVLRSISYTQVYTQGFAVLLSFSHSTSLLTWERCLCLSLSAYNLLTQWTQEDFTDHQTPYLISVAYGFLFAEWIKEQEVT